MKYGNTSKIYKVLRNSCIVWSRFLWRPSTWLHSNSPTRAQNTQRCSWLSWHVATHLGTIPLVPSNLLPSLYNWDTLGYLAEAQLQSLSLHREAWEFQAPRCKLKSCKKAWAKYRTKSWALNMQNASNASNALGLLRQSLERPGIYRGI